MAVGMAIDETGFLLNQLAAPALRALAIGGITGLALTIFRVKSTRQRLFTWTTVLYAALAMPLLPSILPPLAIRIPAAIANTFTAQNSAVPASPSALASYQSSVPAAAKLRAEGSLRGAGAARQASFKSESISARESFWLSIHWSNVAVGVYLLVFLLFLARFVMGMVFASRLRARARIIEDHDLNARLATNARASKFGRVPTAAESELISVPAAVGTFRPTILLPCAWREWDRDKLDAVLAHEMSHIARRDSVTQHLSLLHRAIFWFSPLAWWLNRHLVELAEQASDEAALSIGADRNQYAKTLLGFFEVLHTDTGRIRWQGVSMANAGSAEQRLEKILSWKGTVTMGLKKSVAVVTIALALPVVYLAASARPMGQEVAPATPKAPAAPVVATGIMASPAIPALAPAAPAIPANGGIYAPGPAPAAPAYAPPAPPAPIAPQSPSVTTSSGQGYSYAYSFDDDQRFVIVSGKTDAFTMSGSGQDARHVEKLRKQIPGDFIWFQRDEKSYIIRDQATIDQARKLWAPQEELGKKQEELGKQQEALGKQQEELGTRMEQVRVNVPDMAAQLDKLKAELKQLGSGATQEQIGKLQEEVGELQSKIGEVQSHAGEEQSKLGEEMGKLGEQQGKLGEQQGELGRQQGELAKEANGKMKALLDEAIKKGTAQPEPQTDGGPGTI